MELINVDAINPHPLQRFFARLHNVIGGEIVLERLVAFGHAHAAFGGDDRGFFQRLGLLQREPHQFFRNPFAINIRQIEKRVARFLRGEQRLHAGLACLGRYLARLPTAGDAPATVGQRGCFE